MKVVTTEYLNGNEFLCFPADARASFEPYTTDDLAQINSLLVDARISVPKDVVGSVFISGITVTDKLVSVTLMSIRDNPFGAVNFSPATVVDADYDALGAKLLGTVQATVKQAKTHRPVPITPALDGVAGWLCFGSGVQRPGKWTFSGAAAAKLDDRVVFRTQTPGVTTLGISGLSAELTGAVLLKGANGLEVVKTNDSSLHLRFAGDAATVKAGLEDFIGTCGGRPESYTCSFDPVRAINDIGPDANGEVILEFSKDLPIQVVNQQLSISSPITIENLCLRTAPPGYDACRASTVTALAEPRTAPAVDPLPQGTRLTLEAYRPGYAPQTVLLTYVGQHPARTHTAIFRPNSGNVVADEAVAELQLDMAANLWQAYGNVNSTNPSLQLYGGLGKTLFGTKLIGDYTVTVSQTLGLDAQAVTSIDVTAMVGTTLLPASGNYVRRQHGKYVKDAYVIDMLADGVSEFWWLRDGETVIAGGRLNPAADVLGTSSRASATNELLTVVTLEKP